MSALADFLVGFATAALTATLTVKAPITRATMTFFTVFPSIFCSEYDPVRCCWMATSDSARRHGLTLLPCDLVRGGHLLRRTRAAPLHGDRRGRHKLDLFSTRVNLSDVSWTPLGTTLQLGVHPRRIARNTTPLGI